MVKRFFSLVALIALVHTGAVNSASAQVKVGYTDHEAIIAVMPEYGQIQAQLQQEYNGAQEALQSLAADFQAEVDKYQKQQPLLSEERRAEREQELAVQQQELQAAAGRKDQELAALEVDLMQPIFDRVQAAIDKVAQSKGLDLVLRHRVGAQPVILYRNEDTVADITLEVAAELGIEIPEGDTAAANAN